jgi:hypothetical protein
MSVVLERRKQTYFTTARVIHTPNAEFSDENDWLWVNGFETHHFDTEDEAESLANLANHNGSENGINVVDYPYFVIHVTRTSEFQKVS